MFFEGEDESLWGPIPFLYDSEEDPPWEKTEWDRVDQLLGEAIINIIYTAEESQDIWDHKWLNNMRFNVELLDTVPLDIISFIVDYYTKPDHANLTKSREFSPEFLELKQIMDEEISFEEVYNKLVNSDF